MKDWGNETILAFFPANIQQAILEDVFATNRPEDWWVAFLEVVDDLRDDDSWLKEWANE